jgi:membrane protein DedA with SNARE-associated domain
VGFAGAIAGACVTYWVGLRALLREGSPVDEG